MLSKKANKKSQRWGKGVGWGQNNIGRSKYYDNILTPGSYDIITPKSK